jgi:hypothetical protein
MNVRRVNRGTVPRSVIAFVSTVNPVRDIRSRLRFALTLSWGELAGQIVGLEFDLGESALVTVAYELPRNSGTH